MSRSPGSRIPGIPESPKSPISRFPGGPPGNPDFPEIPDLGVPGSPKTPVFGTRKRGGPRTPGGISEPEYHIISRTPPGFQGLGPLSPPQNPVFSGFFGTRKSGFFRKIRDPASKIPTSRFSHTPGFIWDLARGTPREPQKGPFLAPGTPKSGFWGGDPQNLGGGPKIPDFGVL